MPLMFFQRHINYLILFVFLERIVNWFLTQNKKEQIVESMTGREDLLNDQITRILGF